MNPMFAALCAWPILGEALTPLQMLAGLAVVGGILLAAARPQRYPSRPNRSHGGLTPSRTAP